MPATARAGPDQSRGPGLSLGLLSVSGAQLLLQLSSADSQGLHYQEAELETGEELDHRHFDMEFGHS